MKHSTEYITGKPKSHFEPCITTLANERIRTGREVMAMLSKEKNNHPHDDIVELVDRYQAAEESVRWWQRILDEA